MLYGKEKPTVLAVSNSVKYFEAIREILPAAQFPEVIHAVTLSDAKRFIMTCDIDIVIISTPLTDGFGIDFAIEITDSASKGILLLVKNELYEQVTEKVEGFGILTLTKPASPQVFLQSVKILSASAKKIKIIEEENIELKFKMEEYKTVSRAKLLLMENFGMTEPEAHHYIEKRAMDASAAKKTIAENIIKSYAN